MTLPLTQEERRDLLVSVGTHRGQRRLSPVEVAGLFQRAIGAGSSLSECATAAGLKGTEMVKRFLRLLDLPPSVQVTVSWGQSDTTLPFTAASEIARLPSHLQEPTIREALARGLSSSEVKQVVQRMARSEITPEAAVSEMLALRPVIEQRHVFIGRFSDPKIGKRIEILEQDERDELLAVALRELIGKQRVATRLTPAGFVITGSQDLADTLHSLGDFEATIYVAVGEQLDLA